MRRYFVLQGDPTTAGGTVLEGLLDQTYNGIGVAYHGALISCRSCKATGSIHCVPPRRPFTLSNGQQIAMEGDLCLCRCPRPPKLMATQRTAWMGFESSEGGELPIGSMGASGLAQEAAAAAEAVSLANEPAQADDKHSEQFIVVDPLTGNQAQHSYAMLRQASVLKSGSTDDEGQTLRHVQDEKSEAVVLIGPNLPWANVAHAGEDAPPPAGHDEIDALGHGGEAEHEQE